MNNFTVTVHALQEFGWILNFKKSALIPTRWLKYLGLILDLVQAKVFFFPTGQALKMLKSR